MLISNAIDRLIVLSRREKILEILKKTKAPYSLRILQSVEKNDKRKFMYEIQQEDVELIEDGKKLRKIRKIIL